MKVKVKYTSENAKELYLKASNGKTPFPFKTFNDDFCYDVVATSCEEVAPNVYKYGIGLAFQIERDWETIIENVIGTDGNNITNKTEFDFSKTPLKLSLDLRPRSSVWKTGMVLSNCEGTVDEGYTGEISAFFYHVLPHMQRYTVGQKIAQMKIGATFPCDFIVVDELSTTSRNSNGYGSTGE